MHRPSLALVALLAAAGVFVGAGPAAADGSLVPGATQTVVLPVPDGWAAAADTVNVAVDELVQLENDCIEPEQEAGDDCTDDTGELGDKLVATVAWGTGDDCRPAVDMVPLDLAGGGGTRFEHVAGVECLVVDLMFPHGDSDDLAQSDSLTFRVDAVAEEAPGEVAGASEPEDVDPSSTSLTDGVPPAAGGGAPVDGVASTQGEVGPDAGAEHGAREASGFPPAEPAVSVEDRPSAGPMVGRVDAEVSAGADGVSVMTQAAETSLTGLALAWSSLLLGAIALGWVGFVLVRRRRTRAAA